MMLILILSTFHSTIPSYCSQTTLILEPDSIELPYIDLKEGNLCFEISLKIKDVSRLKEFHIDFNYDPNIVKVLTGKIDRTFYLACRGGRGSAFDKQLADPYSGTGVMYTYTFRVLKPGNTTITLLHPELLNDRGEPIELETEDCTVSILPFEEYSEAEYQALQNEYSILQKSYDELESNYTHLINGYEELEENLKEKTEEYTDLLTDYNNTQTELDSLEEDYSSLKTNYTQSQNLIEELDETKLQLEKNTTQLKTLLLAAGAVTIILIILIVRNQLT